LNQDSNFLLANFRQEGRHRERSDRSRHRRPNPTGIRDCGQFTAVRQPSLGHALVPAGPPWLFRIPQRMRWQWSRLFCPAVIVGTGGCDENLHVGFSTDSLSLFASGQPNDLIRLAIFQVAASLAGADW